MSGKVVAARRGLIVEWLAKVGPRTAAEVSERFGHGQSTPRNDLAQLERFGKIRRAPGRERPTVVDGREVPIAWEVVP